MKTEVYRRGKPRFDMTGQFLGYPLKIQEDGISPGLAKRLHSYAVSRAEECGFGFVVDWEPTVYTMDAEDKPSDRSYGVLFQNELGGYIELSGILTSKGWPSIDHGWSIG